MHDNNELGIHDGAQAVGNDEAGSVRFETMQGVLYAALRQCVQGRCGLLTATALVITAMRNLHLSVCLTSLSGGYFH